MESADYPNRHKAFWSQVHKIHLERLEKRKRTASQFNIFDALGLTFSELSHSKFLRFLLDPTEEHGQGALFLNAFLSSRHQIYECDLSPTRALPEKVLGDSGRVDIAIHLPDDRIILIENKVDSLEGEDQVERYLDWLEKQKGRSNGEHALLFLTRNGRPPISTQT